MTPGPAVNRPRLNGALDPYAALRPMLAPRRAGTVLTLNSGSSSLKFGVHRVDGAAAETLLAETLVAGDAAEALQAMARRMADCGLPAPDAIGHRLVHGGWRLRQPCRIDDEVLVQLARATVFAPLHLPPALALVHAAAARYPGVLPVACFDTAFHASMPELARRLPIDRSLQGEGLQRYGFHGLSCESILRQLEPLVPVRLIIAHLGSGASVTAVRQGRSVDTSMGLTPSGGVLMGTRSGDLDPGLLLYLMRERGFDAAALEALVDHRSGLLGISGLSGDLRVLRAAAPTHPDARLAIQMFCQSVCKQIAAMIAVLDGVDLLVFTGGIGENDAEVRAAICAGLGWMGVSLDPAHNAPVAGVPVIGPIHAPASRCAVQVRPSREDAEVARHTAVLLEAAVRQAA